MLKIPVVIVLNTFCIGGAEILVSQFMEFESNNIDNEFEYYVIELWPSKDIDYQEIRENFEKFSKIHYLNIKKKPFRSLMDFLTLLRERKVRVIHSHFTVASIVSMIGKILNPSIKFVITEHSMTNLNWTLSLKSILYAISLTFSDAIVSVSEESKGYILNQIPWKRKSVTLALNAINLTPLLKILNIRNNNTLARSNHIRLCLICRLVPEKNVSDAIDVCNLIYESGHFVSLTIIGDGPFRSSLEHYAHTVAKFDFKFAGFSNNIAHYLLESDGLLSMSVDESFSLVILEALASGIPCFGFENKAKSTFDICKPPLYLYPYRENYEVAKKVVEVLGQQTGNINFSYIDCLKKKFDIKKHANEMHCIYKIF